MKRYSLHKTIVDYARMQPVDNAVYQRLAAWARCETQKHRHNSLYLKQELPNLLAGMEVASHDVATVLRSILCSNSVE